MRTDYGKIVDDSTPAQKEKYLIRLETMVTATRGMIDGLKSDLALFEAMLIYIKKSQENK